jgi:glycosyltransferase involved in cell wall biosynthesis
MIDDEKNGYLINLFDDETFYKRLKQMIKDEDLREKMGRKSKELIKPYSVEKISNKIFSFITKSVDKRTV